MQKPPSPHRWGLAHSFRSERMEGGASGGRWSGFRNSLKESRPPLALSASRFPALLTHARASPGAHVQAVAAVAMAVVGAAGVHADAPAVAAGLRLALVHV